MRTSRVVLVGHRSPPKRSDIVIGHETWQCCTKVVVLGIKQLRGLMPSSTTGSTAHTRREAARLLAISHAAGGAWVTISSSWAAMTAAWSADFKSAAVAGLAVTSSGAKGDAWRGT